MKDRDSQTHRWSEADVDSLLTDFFRAEMPAELRRESRVESRERLDAVAVPSRDGARRSAGYKGLGVAACAMMLAVLALSSVGRKLVPSRPAETVAPKETPAQPVVAEKESTRTENIVVDKPPLVTPPPALMRAIPPELRPPHENMEPVNNGEDDPLDLRDLLRIEVFEPRDASKRPRVPQKRPRLPEER
jgi:hypothetical protein